LKKKIPPWHVCGKKLYFSDVSYPVFITGILQNQHPAGSSHQQMIDPNRLYRIPSLCSISRIQAPSPEA
jgi:hypothetical protein